MTYKIMNRFTVALVAMILFAINANSQELVVIESKNLKCNDSILIFTPKNVNEKTPTLFLLHGWSGCYKDWSNKHNIQEISDRTNFRIICPDGFYNGWYLNNTNPEKMQWRTFFWSELFPMMEKKFNLTPEKTFITGLSMGGHGAMNLFIDNPDKFKSAGSMSGVLDLELTPLKNKGENRLPEVIGDKVERLAQESAINRIHKLEGKNKPFIISCGYDDFYVRCTDLFSEKCRYMGIPHFVLLTPGKHSWPYWGFALEQHIAFFQKLMRGDNLGY